MSREERIYRALLTLLLPADVEARAREEMAEVFVDLRERVRGRGWRARIAFWPRVVADLVWTSARWRADGAAGRSSTPRAEDGMGRRGERRMVPALTATMLQAVRGVARRPARTLLPAVTVGLAVGAGVLVAALGRDVLLRPLPWVDADRVVRLRELDEDGRQWWPSRANFEDWRAAGAPGALAIEAATIPEPVPVIVGEGAVRARVAEASAGLFDLLGAGFARGRAPTPDEATPGGAPVAVVRHAFWTRELGARVLTGVEVVVGTERFPVVGVLEPEFGFIGEGGAWDAPDVWLPLERAPDASGRRSHGIHVVARLGPGVTRAAADAELDRMAARVADAHREPTHAHSVWTTSLEADLLGPARRSIAFLLAGAVAVLLVAALNLAGTLLVDGIGRGRELAVRQALGARRGRIVGQLVAEALVAAVPGALLGLALATAGLGTARRLDPGALPRLDAVTVDAGTFLLAAAVAVALAVLAAVGPGLLLSRPGATRGIASVGRSGPGRGLRRVWSGMIVLQVALTFALLVGTGALVRGLVGLIDRDLGYQPAGVVSLQVSLPESRFPADGSRLRYWEEALAAVRALPGVEAATVTDVLPHVTQARISGTTLPDVDGDAMVWAGFRLVDPAYFETLRIPLTRGAFPEPGRMDDVVIDRTVAERLLGGDPLGRRVRNGVAGREVTVSGVVGQVGEWAVEPGVIGTIYADIRSAPERPLEAHVLVRGAEGRLPPAAALRAALRSVDDGVPVVVEPLETIMGRTLGSRRLVLWMTAVFGTLGLLFACLGVYGVVAWVASRTRREAGIRLALGARPVRVRARALSQGMLPASAGLVLGAGLVGLLGRVAAGRVEGLEGVDPVSFAGAAVVLVGVAALAAWAPARRVGRVDVVRVLHEG